MIMANTELKRYLGYVLEGEKNVLILKNTANRMYNDIQSLGKPKPIPKPEKIREDSWDVFKGTLMLFGIAAIIGAVVGFLIGFIYVLIVEDGNIILVFLGALLNGLFQIIKGAVIGAIIVGPILLFFTKRTVEKNQTLLNKEKQTSYSNAVIQDQDRIQRELRLKNNTIKYYEVIRHQLTETQQVLSKLYGLNIIHKDYRDIIAISSFYQYIDTGMCYTLEGHEGAYTLYLHESWYRELSSKADTIINMLQQIQANQFVLLRAVNFANEKIDRLTKTAELTLSYAEATAQNSEIIAYNTEITARNTEFLKWMELYKSIKS